MSLSSGEQPVLIVLFFAHVLIDCYLPARRRVKGPGRIAAPVIMGVLTAVCFLNPIGIVAGLLAGLGYAAVRQITFGRSDPSAFWYVGTHASSILVLMLAVHWTGFPGGGRWLDALAGPPLQAIAIMTGLVFMWRQGSTAVGLLVEDLDFEPAQGIPDAGRLIGQLERTLILFMVLAGVPSGIGLLIAAKSVLRFGDVNAEKTDNRRMAEYVIIGTLASFAFAVPVAYAIAALVGRAQ